MSQVISKDTVDKSLSTYYSILSSMGYTKPSVVKKLLRASFIIDFLDTMGYFLNAEEYDLIGKAYSKLGVGGGCILPYNEYKLEKRSFPKTERSFWNMRYNWISEP